MSPMTPLPMVLILIVAPSPRQIAELDPLTGAITKRIFYGSAEQCYFDLMGYGSTIFATFASDLASIKKIDLGKMTSNSDGNGSVTIEPFFTLPAHPESTKMMIGVDKRFIDNGRLYCNWYGLEPPSAWTNIGGVICVNCTTGEIIWNTSINSFSASNIILDDARVYVEGRDGTIALDKTTGAELWYCPHVRGSTHGGTIDGDYLYTTTHASMQTNADQLQGCYGIACINKTTGALRWSVPPNDMYGRGLQPQVANGILYVADCEGIELYDALNGDYLGRSTSAKGEAFQLGHTRKVGDLLILYNVNGFTAVKMNLVRGPGGRLTKLP